jgi:hypothetical protein
VGQEGSPSERQSSRSSRVPQKTREKGKSLKTKDRTAGKLQVRANPVSIGSAESAGSVSNDADVFGGLLKGRIVAIFRGIVAGAGTVLTVQDAAAAMDAGAQFIVAQT